MSIELYWSYSEIFGSEISYEQLTSHLAEFSQDSVLWHCAAISYGAKIWEANLRKPNSLLDQELENAIRFYFPQRLAFIITHRLLAKDRRVPFHRRQILAIQKLALQHCGTSGTTVDAKPHVFGLLLLMVSDHLHQSHSASNRKVLERPSDFAELMADLLPISEAGDEHLGLSLARTRMLLERIAAKHLGRPGYFDIIGTFETTTGIAFNKFRSFLFASVAYINVLSFTEILMKRGDVCLNSHRFKRTALTANELSAAFAFLSETANSVTRRIANRDYGLNDLTELRRSPLLDRWWNVGRTDQWCGYLILDPIYLFDKVQTAPYWLLRSIYGQSFSIFWGVLFEDYCNELMNQACFDSSLQYISNPEKSGKRQICDGILLEDKRIILLEYKVCMMSAEAKYSGDPSLLQRGIEKHLVRSSDGKKATEQLGDAIEHLFGSERGIENLTPDWKNLTEVMPCVITMDAIGGAIGLSPMLQ